jgi:hypothetical protein
VLIRLSFTDRGFMRNFVTALLAGIGMGMLVGGLLTVVGSHLDQKDQVLEHLGPLSGVWHANQSRFAGAILASFGSGIFTFALLVRRKG